MKSNKRKRFCLFLVLVIAGLIVAFLVYVNVFYHEDHTALDALESDSMVAVVKTDYGWLFDGPSDTDALIFYPGANVEETAYASLLHSLAGEGMDVCLVKMPFRLAFFGTDKADDIIPQYSYENWYIGGHSLGGQTCLKLFRKNLIQRRISDGQIRLHVVIRRSLAERMYRSPAALRISRTMILCLSGFRFGMAVHRML